MSMPSVNPYLRTKIMTASADELRLMLFDGALKFCRQAQTALEAKSFEDSFNNLMRAQKIVLELSTSLNPEVDPDLTAKMSAIYTFIYRRLVDANMERDPAPIDEAIRLLHYERETWVMLMNKAQGKADASNSAPAPRSTPMSPASVTGARQTALGTYSRSA